VGLRLATYNVENLFARAKALNADTFGEGEPALAAYGEFNRLAPKPKYLPEDKAAMLAALAALRVLVRTPGCAATTGYMAWTIERLGLRCDKIRQLSPAILLPPKASEQYEKSTSGLFEECAKIRLEQSPTISTAARRVLGVEEMEARLRWPLARPGRVLHLRRVRGRTAPPRWPTCASRKDRTTPFRKVVFRPGDSMSYTESAECRSSSPQAC
jgi:hypothetical protein